MTQTTQPQPAAPSAVDAFLRRGRELLAQGRLAPAAAAGWQAAVHALNAYAATPTMTAAASGTPRSGCPRTRAGMAGLRNGRSAPWLCRTISGTTGWTGTASAGGLTMCSGW